MIIEKNNPIYEPKVLAELETGDGFFYRDVPYIVINNDKIAHTVKCVNLKTGDYDFIKDYAFVRVIDKIII